MNLHMERRGQMIPFWSFSERHHIIRETEHIFAVFTYGVNAQEVLSALTGMRCLKQESCRSKILRIATMGMCNTWLLFYHYFLYFCLYHAHLYSYIVPTYIWHVHENLHTCLCNLCIHVGVHPCMYINWCRNHVFC